MIALWTSWSSYSPVRIFVRRPISLINALETAFLALEGVLVCIMRVEISLKLYCRRFGFFLAGLETLMVPATEPFLFLNVNFVTLELRAPTLILIFYPISALLCYLRIGRVKDLSFPLTCLGHPFPALIGINYIGIFADSIYEERENLVTIFE